jgi:hypothetical protein
MQLDTPVPKKRAGSTLTMVQALAGAAEAQHVCDIEHFMPCNGHLQLGRQPQQAYWGTIHQQ